MVGHGQSPVFTSADLGYQPGDVHLLRIIPGDSFDIGGAGANQTWDFSATLRPFLTTPPDTLRYVNPATTPYRDSFPSATVTRLVSQQYIYY